jgi:hypothetical protein
VSMALRRPKKQKSVSQRKKPVTASAPAHDASSDDNADNGEDGDTHPHVSDVCSGRVTLECS